MIRNETQKQNWRSRFQSLLDTGTTSAVRGLQWVVEHEHTSDSLACMLSALLSLQHLLQVGAAAGILTTEDTRRAEAVTAAARSFASKYIQELERHYHEELQTQVARYQTRPALLRQDQKEWDINEVINEIMHREIIEAYLRASELLHPALVPIPAIQRIIQKTDREFREVISQFAALWAAWRPPLTLDEREERENINPRAHWWWWLLD